MRGMFLALTQNEPCHAALLTSPAKAGKRRWSQVDSVLLRGLNPWQQKQGPSAADWPINAGRAPSMRTPAVRNPPLPSPMMNLIRVLLCFWLFGQLRSFEGQLMVIWLITPRTSDSTPQTDLIALIWTFSFFWLICGIRVGLPSNYRCYSGHWRRHTSSEGPVSATQSSSPALSHARLLGVPFADGDSGVSILGGALDSC